MITNETKTATCELCGGTGLRGGAGEQRCSCGAVPPSSHILDLLDQYWNIAYQQGIEGRSHDNEAGDAQRVLSEITAALALLPGEPVGWIWKLPGGDEWQYRDGSKKPDSLGLPKATAARVILQPVYAVPAPLPVAVKALEWSEHAPPNEDCRYDHATAKGVFLYSIEWKSWKPHDAFVVYRDGDFVASEHSLDEAQAAAQADYETHIRSALSSPVGGTEEPMAIIERCAAIADDAAADFERQAHLEENAIRHDSLFLVADGCELVAEAIRELKGSSASPTPASDIAALMEDSRHSKGERDEA